MSLEKVMVIVHHQLEAKLMVQLVDKEISILGILVIQLDLHMVVVAVVTMVVEQLSTQVVVAALDMLVESHHMAFTKM